MRPIDADALINRMYYEAFENDESYNETNPMARWDSGLWIRYKMFENAIDEQPIIEPKRGEWVVYEGGWKDLDYYPPKCKCNQCGYEEELYILNAKPTNFCPNCGADMREPTISKMEQVEDEPMKTTDYCDICKRDMCEDCIADATNPYCVPSHYEINYEPNDEPTTQMKTQNSNLTFEKRTMRDCYNCKRYETEGECIECHYEPKDEPQTCSVNGRPYDCGNCEYHKCTADEPQTEVIMPKKCKGCDSASKIIEAYSRGWTDGAEAVKAMPQTDCAWGKDG